MRVPHVTNDSQFRQNGPPSRSHTCAVGQTVAFCCAPLYLWQASQQGWRGGAIKNDRLADGDRHRVSVAARLGVGAVQVFVVDLSFVRLLSAYSCSRDYPWGVQL